MATAKLDPLTGDSPSRRSWAARPTLLATLAGGTLGLALPPVGFLPAMLALPLLLALLRREPGPRAAFRLSFCFFVAFAAAGLWWVGIAFLTDVRRFGPIAVPAVALLCITVALTQAGVVTLVSLWNWRSAVAQALALAVALSFAEWLRGSVLGFPWNPVAIVWTVTDVTLQPLAWLGDPAFGLLTLAALLPLAVLAETPSRPVRLAAIGVPVAFVAAIVLAGFVRIGSIPERTAEPPLPLRIVQANVQQDLKWDPERLREWFLRHLDLSARPAEDGFHPAVVIWPESAVAYSLDEDPNVQAALAGLIGPGGVLLTGADRVDRKAVPITVSNSLYVIGDTGTPLGRYDKHDLVPFGEFLPFRSILGALGLGSVTGGSVDFTRGPGRVTMDVPGLPPFSPLICYEVVFPTAATDGSGRARWLVNVTNDGWYGRSSGPYQHLAMARMRAVEEGLPLVRAANTGISVVTDAAGRIVARLELGQTGRLDAMLPEALAERPWGGAHGMMLYVISMILISILAIGLERRA